MTNTSFFRGLAFFCLYAILIVPFIVTDSLYFPYITGKAFMFYTLVQIATVSWLIVSLKDKTVHLRGGRVLYAVIAFLSIATIADFFGIDPQISIWGNFERMDSLVTLVNVVLFFILLSSLFKKDTKHWDYYIGTSIALSTIMCIYAFFQAAEIADKTDIIRVSTSLGNTIYLASYLLLHLFMIAWFFVRTKVPKIRITLFVLGLMHFVALYLTSTRGALLGLAVGTLVTTLYISVFERKDKFIRRASIGIFSAMIVGAGLFFTFKDSNFIQGNPTLSRIANSSFTKDTGYSRGLLWTAIAPDGIKERPLLGWGQGGFSAVFDKYYDPRMYAQEQWFDRSHNILIDWLIAAGILGFVAYLGIFVVAIINIIKLPDSNTSEKAVLLGMLIAYLIQNLFVFDNLINYIFFFILLAYIHDRNSYNKKVIWFSDRISQTITIILIVSIAIFFYMSTMKPYMASYQLLQGIRVMAPTTDGSMRMFHPTINDNYDYYDKALANSAYTGRAEVVERLLSTTESVLRVPEIDAEVKQKFVDRAYLEMDNLIVERPHYARYPFLFGIHFLKIGNNELAVVNLKKASELSPDKQSIRQVYSVALYRTGKIEEAVQIAKETYELETSHDAMWITYVQMLFNSGKTEEAISLFKIEEEKENYARLIAWYRPEGRETPLSKDEYNALFYYLEKTGQISEIERYKKMLLDKEKIK